jgi:phosphoglycerate dehydrogenase-like enzyme
MKIAFLHRKSYFNSDILKRLRITLAQHEVYEWIDGSNGPIFDIEVLLVMGNVGRQLLNGQPNLALIHNVSDGYKEVDIDAASELGIWVSYASAEQTGNATSVAEFAILPLLGAARHLGEAVASLQCDAVQPLQIGLALSGKTVCIIGLGSIGQKLVDRLRPLK